LPDTSDVTDVDAVGCHYTQDTIKRGAHLVAQVRSERISRLVRTGGGNVLMALCTDHYKKGGKKAKTRHKNMIYIYINHEQ